MIWRNVERFLVDVYIRGFTSDDEHEMRQAENAAVLLDRMATMEGFTREQALSACYSSTEEDHVLALLRYLDLKDQELARV